jgi:site-specific recombinase XerD
MLPQCSHKCSHITRKRGVYYYRRRLPGVAKGEVTVSLRTHSYREAQWLAAGLDVEFGRIIASVKEDNKPADIQRIAREYLKSKLEFDMVQRAASSHIGVYSRSRELGRIAADDLEWVEGELQTAKTELRERLYEHQMPLIDQIMKNNAVPPERRDALAHSIFQANVAFWETVRQRTLGNFSSEPHELEEPKSPPTDANALPVVNGPPLSEVLPGFLKFMSDQGVWRGQTLAQNRATYDMFIECCGDRPVASYERKDLAEFFDLLRGLPKLYSKSAEWKGLPLAEIVARSNGQTHERLSIKTMKRHFSALGRLFAYLRKRGEYLAENPAYGFEFPDKRRARDKRNMWEGESLTKLFSSPVWTGCFSEGRRSRPGSLIIKDEKYWLPLLALYHGNRLEEFAQLCRGDVQQQDGSWFLDINDEGLKQVKNEQSKRRVPLHSELHRLGFLDYVEKTAPNATDRIFPQLQPGGPDKKLGYFFTKWWTTYRKDVGVYEKGLDYHSFRAGVTTKLATAGVSLEVRNELLGHEGKSVDEQTYLKGFPLSVLAQAINLVLWPEVRL